MFQLSLLLPFLDKSLLHFVHCHPIPVPRHDGCGQRTIFLLNRTQNCGNFSVFSYWISQRGEFVEHADHLVQMLRHRSTFQQFALVNFLQGSHLVAEAHSHVVTAEDFPRFTSVLSIVDEI